jgi:hypothetical protein
MPTGSSPGTKGRGRLGRVVRALPAVIGAAGLAIVLTACRGTQVLVDVMHPPKIPIPPQVKEIAVEEFQGSLDCAKPLKPKLVTKVTESEVYTIAVEGLSLSEETLTIKGTVTTCTLSLGSGTLNAEVSAWYMGNQVFQEVVSEHTARPGAPQNEVRDALVNRITNRIGKVLPLKRKEVRTFFPVDGNNDTGVKAAEGGNWPLALESFGKQIKDRPSEHRAWYNRGIAYEATAQFKAAVKDLQKAIELKRRDEYVEALARVDREMQGQKTIETIKRNAE